MVTGKNRARTTPAQIAHFAEVLEGGRHTTIHFQALDDPGLSNLADRQTDTPFRVVLTLISWLYVWGPGLQKKKEINTL